MANASRVRSRLEQDPRQLFEPGSRRLVQGRVASGLRHVYVRSLRNQKAHRLAILAQGNAGMQWLIVHRVAREAVHMRSVGKQQSRCLRVRQTRLPGEEAPSRRPSSHEPAWHPAAAAIRCGRNPPAAEASKISRAGQMGEQEIPDQRLAVINAPQKSRDALGVSASNQRWIFFRGGGDFRRLAAADQVKKTLAHRPRLASVPYRFVSPQKRPEPSPSIP